MPDSSNFKTEEITVAVYVGHGRQSPPRKGRRRRFDAGDD